MFGAAAPQPTGPSRYPTVWANWAADPDEFGLTIRNAADAQRALKHGLKDLARADDAERLARAWERQSLVCDALWLAGFPLEAGEIEDVFRARNRTLNPNAEPHPLDMGGAPHSADDESTKATGDPADHRKASFMFGTAQTGGDGLKGPFLNFTSNGSAAKGFAPKTWYVRAEDINGNKTDTATTCMQAGAVFDIFGDGNVGPNGSRPNGSLKLGWARDKGGRQGVERRWNSDTLVPTQRPDDSLDSNGRHAWKPTFAISVATKEHGVITWNGESASAYGGFVDLLNGQIAQQINANPNKCPVVRVTGYEDWTNSSGSGATPKLEVVAWIDRPASLAAEGPTFAAAPAPAPQPAPASAPQPAPAAQAPAPQPVPADDFSGY